MKKVIRVITVLAIVGSFSSAVYAQTTTTNGWDFLNTLFTGKGLNQNCTSINASPAQIFATKNNAADTFNFTTENRDGSKTIMSFTSSTNE